MTATATDTSIVYNAEIKKQRNEENEQLQLVTFVVDHSEAKEKELAPRIVRGASSGFPIGPPNRVPAYPRKIFRSLICPERRPSVGPNLSHPSAPLRRVIPLSPMLRRCCRTNHRLTTGEIQ